MSNLIYFSSVSGNTHRFVENLGLPALRLPVTRRDEVQVASEPFVLITPTYGGGPETRAVPKQVMAFLRNPENRDRCVGVIASGNTNFGEAYCLAGKLIARKLGVPLLYRFELFGTPEDVDAVREGLSKFWAAQGKGTA